MNDFIYKNTVTVCLLMCIDGMMLGFETETFKVSSIVLMLIFILIDLAWVIRNAKKGNGSPDQNP